MSLRSDDAPVQFERRNYDTCCALMVKIMVGDVQWRQAVRINDADPPSLIARKLHALASWIEKKVAE